MQEKISYNTRKKETFAENDIELPNFKNKNLLQKIFVEKVGNLS